MKVNGLRVKHAEPLGEGVIAQMLEEREELD